MKWMICVIVSYLLYFLSWVLFVGSFYLLLKVYKEGKHLIGYDMKFYISSVCFMVFFLYFMWFEYPILILYFISGFISLFHAYQVYIKKKLKKCDKCGYSQGITLNVLILNFFQAKYSIDLLGIICIIFIFIQLILFYKSYQKLNSEF